MHVRNQQRYLINLATVMAPVLVRAYKSPGLMDMLVTNLISGRSALMDVVSGWSMIRLDLKKKPLQQLPGLVHLKATSNEDVSSDSSCVLLMRVQRSKP